MAEEIQYKELEMMCGRRSSPDLGKTDGVVVPDPGQDPGNAAPISYSVGPDVRNC